MRGTRDEIDTQLVVGDINEAETRLMGMQIETAEQSMPENKQMALASDFWVSIGVDERAGSNCF